MSADADTSESTSQEAMLRRRSRLRWRFSVFLIGIYLVWGVAGVYLPDYYASPFMGIAMPKGIAIAFGIIGLSMLLAVIYVRRVNRYEDEERGA